MLENIKNAIHQNIEELFTTATVDELAGDMSAYKKKLEMVGKIAKILGINTEITEITIHIK